MKVVTVARKPLSESSVALNVLEHGTGAINVDGCRVPGPKPDTTRGAGGANGRYGPPNAQGRIVDDGLGRWPANLIHDGSPEVLAGFPVAGPAKASMRGHTDQGGSAARFFKSVNLKPSDEEIP